MAETGAERRENGCGARGEVRGRVFGHGWACGRLWPSSAVWRCLMGGRGWPIYATALIVGAEDLRGFARLEARIAEGWPMESVENCVKISARFLYTCSLPPFPQALRGYGNYGKPSGEGLPQFPQPLTVESVENRPLRSWGGSARAVSHPYHSRTIHIGSGVEGGEMQTVAF